MTFQITTSNNGSDSLQFKNFSGNLLASITSFDTTGAGNLIVQTNNTNALWLDSKQNLGLGSTPSSWGAGSNALQVGTYASIWSQSSTNQYIYSNAYYNGTNDIFLSSNPAARIRFASGTTIFNYTSSGISGNTVSWLESMRIDNSGNFYVGTTSQSPNTTALMTLWQGASSTKPSIQFTTGNDTNWWGRITASNAGGTIGQFYSSGGAWTVSGTTFSAVKDYNGTFPTSAFFIANQYNSSTSSYFAWLTQAAGSSTTDGAVTQLMTLDNGGNLLLGTTSSIVNAGMLQVVNSGYGWLHRNSGAAAGRYWTFQMTTNGACYIINDSSTGVTLSYGGNSWSTYSDERLKTDFKPIDNAISKVGTLRALTGRYKTDNENVSRAFLIAQDVQAVLPEAVSSDVKVNSDDETEYLTLSYTDTIPLLVKAIQELSAQVAALQTTVTTLQAKVGA
jgi:Chaperone of endosialidase